MQRWENRYAHGRSGNVRAVEHGKAERVRNLLLILLTVALLGVGIAGGRAIAFRGSCDDRIVSRMVTECADAVSLAKNLSRYGGSDSAAILGSIRSSVHAVDVLNELHHTLYGSYLVEPAAYSVLYDVISSYSNKLTKGAAVVEDQNNLVNGLDALSALLQSLN